MTFHRASKSKLCESVPLNTRMIYNPTWREHSPDKWKGSNFIHPTKAKVVSREKPTKRNKRTASCKTEPYIDGLQAVGDRKISREGNTNDRDHYFNSVIPQDPWHKRSIYSDSIRAEKALESVFNNNKEKLKLIVSSRIGSPLRVTNKNFQFQTNQYNKQAMENALNQAMANHQRSSSTGNPGRVNSPQNPVYSKTSDRKSNTARHGKVISASSKISIDYRANPNLKIKNIIKSNLKNMEKAENILESIHSTRYKVTMNYDMSKNKRFQVKEDLSHSHIQQTIDYPKTYYVSALERVRKDRKDGKRFNASGDDYQLPPNPPELSRFELMNMHNFSKLSSKEDKSDVWSGGNRSIPEPKIIGDSQLDAEE